MSTGVVSFSERYQLQELERFDSISELDELADIEQALVDNMVAGFLHHRAQKGVRKNDNRRLQELA